MSTELLRRPVWITAWVSLVNSAFFLIPIVIPIYGTPLPGWAAVGLLAQVLILLAIALRAATRRWGNSYQWLASTGTSAGCALFYMAGVVVLLARQLTIWEITGIGLFGVFALGFLVWVERWAIRLDKERASQEMASLP